MQLQPDCPFIADLKREGIQACDDLHSLEHSSCEEVNLQLKGVT